MSRLDELIKKLCPDGVEYKKIKEISKVLRGKRLTKDKLSDENEFPVYHGGLEPLGYYYESNRTADTVMVINVGASAGTVGYCDKAFWSSDGCYCISHNDYALPRFIYAALSCKESFLKSRVRKAGIPTLDAKVVEELSIPIPPLEVQEEIVKTLDKFIDCVTELQIELQAELKARRQQYEYYMDDTFVYNNTWREIRLENLCSIITKQTGFDYSATIKPSLVSKKTDETIPFIQNKDFSGTSINFNTDYYIPISIAEKYPKIMLNETCLLISISGKIGNVGLYDCESLAFIGGAIAICRLDNNIVDSKYLLYYLMSSLGQKQIFKSIKAASHVNITVDSIRKLRIHYPPLEEQKRIVALLDKFAMLYRDISEGLPMEIEARQKQYEYYRDKLLTFKELS